MTRLVDIDNKKESFMERDEVDETVSGAKQQANSRILTLDVLRGVALLGILTVHTGMIGSPQYIFGYIPVRSTLLDQITIRLVRHSAEAVLYLLFSFMFGVGIAMQARRNRSSQREQRWIQTRRMFFLFLFGMLHTILLWDGDILKIYGVVGFIFLVERWLTSKLLLAGAMITFLGMNLFLGNSHYIPAQPLESGTVIEQPEHVQSIIDLYTDGTYVEHVRWRWQGIVGTMIGQAFLSIGVIFAVLLGMYAGRAGLFESIESKLPTIKKGFWIALFFFALGTGFYILSESTRNGMVYRLGFHISGAAAAAIFIVGVILLMRTDWGEWFLTPFAAVGRLSITNYIMQTIIQITLFYYIGLYGTLSRFALLLIAFLIFWIQILYSRWWSTHFRLGPLEWVWRSLSYWELQPIRRKESTLTMGSHPA